MAYYGEVMCQQKYKSSRLPCKNVAYYNYQNELRCGVHSKKDTRVKLPINPNKIENDKKKKEEIEKKINDAKIYNKENGLKGTVRVSKIRMMKNPEQIDGYLNVFPNFMHGNRKDGYGCATLSPKSIGPISSHKLPLAHNLENFHQFSKFYEFEIDKESGIIKQDALQNRINGFNDKKPHRHKFNKGSIANSKALFSMYYDKHGNERRYTYVQSRYFYCYWYEKLVKELDEYKYLVNEINNGLNINICGYDGYQPTTSLYEHYLDGSRPFGHELVLYTMLVEIPDNYPWKLYYEQHEEIYKDVI